MLFLTHNRESFASRKARFIFNLIPVYIGTRAKIKFISADWKEVHILLPLNIFTRNIAGSVFGGSIYSSIDPVYMFMLIKTLGEDFVVWDKAAYVKFVRPGRTSLKTRLVLSDEKLEQIKSEVNQNGETTIELLVEYLDAGNAVCANITKSIYIADKVHYLEKRRSKGHAAEYNLKVW